MSCLLGLALATSAAGAPPTKLVSIELDKEFSFRSFMKDLPAATDEPGGLVIPVDAGPEYLEIGLQPGDLLRYINGAPASDNLRINQGLFIFDVVRGGKPVVIHLMVHGTTTSSVKLDDDDWQSLQSALKRGPLSTPMTVHGRPSGVRIIDLLLTIHIRFEVGDIVRTIGGRAILGEDQLIDALRNLPIGSTKIVVEREERPHTLMVVRGAPIDLAQIKPNGKNKYRVPRVVASALGAAPALMTRGLEVVPVVRDGVVHGQKLYKIDPTSLASKVGLVNDDVIVDVEGHAVNDLMQVYQAVSDLEALDELTLHVERKGKRFELVFSIVD
ncbi:hypothetical protein BH11MYX1_BH11MYX1_39260 [soil metagenome]